MEFKNGQACIKFSSQLGPPADLHFVTHLPRHRFHDHNQHRPRHRQKGPAQRERDRARAAAHRANQQLLEAVKTAATADAGTTVAGTTVPVEQPQQQKRPPPPT